MADVIAIDVGKPHPVESEFKDQIDRVIDDYADRITYAQCLGIFELIKGEILANAHGWLEE